MSSARQAIATVALVLAALLFAVPYLVAEHRYPLTTFDSEWIAAVLLAAALLAGAAANGVRLSLHWPLPAIGLILLAVATGHHQLGLLHYTYGLTSLLLYLCAMFGAYLLGRWLVAADLRAAALGFVSVAILAAGLLSFVVQVLQLLDVRTLPTWLVVPMIEKMSHRRPFGNIGQPNHLATYLIWGTLAALYLMRRAAPRWPLLAAMAVLFCGLALTSSRMGILFGLALVAVVLVRNPITPDPLRGRLQVIVMLAAGYAVGLVLTKLLLVDDTGTMITAIERYREGTFGQRVSMWSDAWRIAWTHPWLGVGAGEYGGAQYLFARAHPQLLATNNPHNLVLHLAAEYGWPAALAIVAIAAGWCWRRLACLRDDAHGAIAMGLILFLLAHSLLEYPLWHLHFLLALAVLVALAEPAGPGRPAIGLRARFVMLPIGIAALGVCAIMKADFESVATIWDGYLRERMARQPYSLETTGGVVATVGSTYFRPQMERAYVELLPVQVQQGDANLEMSWRVLTRLADEPLIVRHVLLLVQAGRVDESLAHVDRLKVFAGPDYPRFRDTILDSLADNGDVVEPVRRRLLGQ